MGTNLSVARANSAEAFSRLARVFSNEARRDSRRPETEAELFSAFSRKAEKRSTFSGARSSVMRLAVVSMLATMSSARSPRPRPVGMMPWALRFSAAMVPPLISMYFCPVKPT